MGDFRLGVLISYPPLPSKMEKITERFVRYFDLLAAGSLILS
ncbi:hypothetical protein [Desulfosporosinus sp.]|nr:hypothetical protein [Desulfosporosinus sp.]